MKTRHERQSATGSSADPELSGGSGARVGAEPGEREVARAGHRESDREGERRPGSTGDPGLEQEIDGGVSAQPKGGLTGGFDPGSGRMHSALGAGSRTGAVDTAGSGMAVVGDPNRNFDEQDDLRDALPGESAYVDAVAEDRTQLDEYAREQGKTLEQIVPRAAPKSKAAKRSKK